MYLVENQTIGVFKSYFISNLHLESSCFFCCSRWRPPCWHAWCWRLRAPPRHKAAGRGRLAPTPQTWATGCPSPAPGRSYRQETNCGITHPCRTLPFHETRRLQPGFRCQELLPTQQAAVPSVGTVSSIRSAKFPLRPRFRTEHQIRTITTQLPLSQGFVSPQFNFDTAPQLKPRPPVPTNPIKFENFPKTNLPSPQAKPFLNQAPKKPQGPKFVDGYRLENASTDFAFNQKKPQSLQKLKFDAPKTESVVPNKAKSEREEVQLLYVPVESLNRGQFNFRNPVSGPQVVNSDLYQQGSPKPNPVKHTFPSDYQRPVKQSVENIHFGQDYFNYNPQVKEYDQVPKFSTISTPFPTAPPTTPKPKKLKPHQPHWPYS